MQARITKGVRQNDSLIAKANWKQIWRKEIVRKFTWILHHQHTQSVSNWHYNVFQNEKSLEEIYCSHIMLKQNTHRKHLIVGPFSVSSCRRRVGLTSGPHGRRHQVYDISAQNKEWNLNLHVLTFCVQKAFAHQHAPMPCSTSCWFKLSEKGPQMLKCAPNEWENGGSQCR